MLKAAGMIFIVIASSALGAGMSRELAERVKCLSELERLMKVLKGEIQYAATPLPEIFSELSKRTEGNLSAFFAGIAAAMEQRSGSSMGDIFEEQAQRLSRISGLNHRDIQEVARFGRRLGYSDREMQVQAIRLYQEELAAARAQAQEDYRQKAKMYRSLGFLGGCFCALLLV